MGVFMGFLKQKLRQFSDHQSLFFSSALSLCSIWSSSVLSQENPLPEKNNKKKQQQQTKIPLSCVITSSPFTHQKGLTLNECSNPWFQNTPSYVSVNRVSSVMNIFGWMKENQLMLLHQQKMSDRMWCWMHVVVGKRRKRSECWSLVSKYQDSLCSSYRSNLQCRASPAILCVGLFPAQTICKRRKQK